jgi:hypothetical protein
LVMLWKLMNVFGRIHIQDCIDDNYKVLFDDKFNLKNKDINLVDNWMQQYEEGMVI